VLKELPPKEIQDYTCVMPASQALCHTNIERSNPFACSGIQGANAL
jgi:TATA-binding protein-associated factor